MPPRSGPARAQCPTSSPSATTLRSSGDDHSLPAGGAAIRGDRRAAARRLGVPDRRGLLPERDGCTPGGTGPAKLRLELQSGQTYACRRALWPLPVRPLRRGQLATMRRGSRQADRVAQDNSPCGWLGRQGQRGKSVQARFVTRGNGLAAGECVRFCAAGSGRLAPARRFLVELRPLACRAGKAQHSEKEDDAYGCPG